MYGGLFGDLPSTKNSKSADGKAKNDATKESKAEGAVNNRDKQEAKQKQQQISKQDEGTDRKKQASLTDKLGTAGTTRAFVPAALRNRKRLNSASAPSTTRVAPKKIQAVATKEPSKASNQSEVSHIHDDVTTPDYNSQAPSQQEQEESESMRQLHASVVDPYDPHVPNDLLAFWDRKAMEKERLHLEKQAKETLKRQEELRQQLEQERQSLQQSGDLEGIVQHRQQTNMGRGRGVSNLPAWLVQKQKKEQLGNATTTVESKKAQCTVILGNLTAPGDVDDELAEEVKEECEEQCGPVTSVVIKDAQPPHQPVVQVHVEFENRKDAEKAVRVFDGRSFGQRRITAEFMRQ